MKAIIILLLVPVLARAQNPADTLKQGEDIFNKTCANGYCHGVGGAGGGAPRIAARGFDQPFINNIVARGIPNTGMAAFANTLSRGDLAAVVAYVAKLNGIANPAIPANADAAPPSPALPPEAQRGRDLFSDAVRGFGRCSTCHEVNGIGIPVAPPISTVPADTARMKALSTPRVSTATLAGESMPVLIVANRVQSTLFYDLTTSPPVLRTELPSSIQIRDGSTWRHASVIGAYSDSELSSILLYLRAMVRP